MNCSNCQNPIQQGEKFCGKCGKKNGSGANKLLRFCWMMLIILDILSFIIALPFLFFAAGLGGLTTFAIFAVVVTIVGAIQVGNVILFIKNKKISILLSIILFLPVVFYGVYVINGQKKTDKMVEYNKCLKAEQERRYPNKESGWQEKWKKDILESNSI